MTPRSRLADDVHILEARLGRLPSATTRPTLVLLSGLPASGKTYLARKVCRRYPLAHLESDALRNVLFPCPVYSPNESKRLFAAIHRLVDELLARGVAVLLDATNLKQAHRRPLYEIAERRAARLVVVRVEVSDRLARRRIESRGRGGDPTNHSEADIAVYEAMRREQEPIDRVHIRVDTSRNLEAAVDKIVRELEKTQ